MILQWEQCVDIINKNPNKSTIDEGKKHADKLMLHLHGRGMESAIKRCDYFVNEDLYKEQKKYATSNKDVFQRLLQQEDMIFTARGGSSLFNLGESDERQMNELLDDVRYDLSLRKWIRNIALQAYRSDPMGIIFMEVDRLVIHEDGTYEQPKAYPTYKSIYSIFDYYNSGRRLEYVIFKLTAGEALRFGIIDEELKNANASAETSYFRIVDDKKDLLVKRKDATLELVTQITHRNPLPNEWNRTPGFIISDLMTFNNPQVFVSPLYYTVELADTFLDDRSVRNLQKKMHGFAKAIEPLLKCSKCAGNKVVDGQPCPECTVPGQSYGTGYKFKTKPSDVARFPLEMLEKGFDFAKIFGYVTPDIKSWDKQDASLEDLEELMEMTYWGTVRMRRAKPGSADTGEGDAITATESSSNDKPKEARLNMTADWAESTERLIADFIGEYWFPSFKKSAISYGRDYVLKSPEELMTIYLTLRTKGAPDFSLDEALEKYYQAKYQTNPIQLQKYLKMLDVEPFPHLAMANAQGIITDFTDYNCKLYFGEWSNTIPEVYWIVKKPEELRQLLRTYVEAKGIKEPEPEKVPVK
jgi:hypothetical protein